MRAFRAAAATAEPPFGPRFAIAGRPLSTSASFDSAAPTKPTGSPTTSAGATFSSSNSNSAVGAFPTTQMALSPTSPAASLNPAAERVMPRLSGQLAGAGAGDEASRFAARDPGRHHAHVRNDGRVAPQRFDPTFQSRLVENEAPRVFRVRRGVNDPFCDGAGERPEV